jgi:hypothetical protein
MGTGSFPGVKRPGRGIDHPHPSSVEVKERVEIYMYSPSVHACPVLGVNFTFTFLFLLEGESGIEATTFRLSASTNCARCFVCTWWFIIIIIIIIIIFINCNWVDTRRQWLFINIQQ